MKRMALLTLTVLLAALTLSLGCGGGDGDEGKDGKTNEETKTGNDATTGDDVPLPCVEVCEDGTLPDVVTPDTAEEDVSPAEDIAVEPDVVLPAGCEEVGSFVPCGGKVEGAWKWDAVCLDPSMFENPLKDTCPTATMSVELTWDATIEFAAGTYATTFNKQQTDIFMTIPKSCLPQGAGCDVFGEDMSCTDNGEACECTQTQLKEEPSTDSGTYVVEGTNLVMTDSEGEVSTAPFCIAGDKVVVEVTDTNEEGKIQKLYFFLSKI